MEPSPGIILSGAARVQLLLEVFEELPRPLLDDIDQGGEWVQLTPGQTMSQLSLTDPERFFFLLTGQLTLVLDLYGLGEMPAEQERSEYREHLTFLVPGDFFSTSFLRLRKAPPDPQLDCVAQTQSVLVGLPAHTLTRMMRAEPRWSQDLKRRNGALREHFLRHQQPSRRMVQNFFFQNGLSIASALRVVQLDRCLECDKCQKACAERHGAARLTRKGPRLGQLAFPIACRRCTLQSCLKACAFGAITLDEETGEARIGKKCAGCGGCAKACPNGVISMREKAYAAEDFPLPIPQTDPAGLTNVPGMYVIGDATGDALIKIAINAGKRAIDHIAAAGKPLAQAPVQDVIIVGAGPGGLSAALSCQQKQLGFLVFDKGSFASTIQNFPKRKLVMAEPAHLPLYGPLWLQNATKEELIEKWQEIIDQTGLTIREREAVSAISHEADGTFLVQTDQGQYQSSAVVMAIGARGSPRPLGIPDEQEPRVQYLLTDPDAFAGQRVLVVGGGDSAVEAAMSLADVADTTVSLSYRKESFDRIKALNRERLSEYEADGRITTLFKSTVARLGPGQAVLKIGQEEKLMENDVVFALLGAEPPTKFLAQAGICILEPASEQMTAHAAAKGMRQQANKCDHCQGFPDLACVSACPTGALLEVAPEQIFVQTIASAGPREDFSETPFLAGVAAHLSRKTEISFPWLATSTLLLCIGSGLECFLRRTMPELSLQGLWKTYLGTPPEISFTSGKGFGHALGYGGSALMIVALLYFLRSRLGWLQAISARTWLRWHVWMGIAGTALVTYHSALKLERWAGISLAASWLVTLTGMMGRYLYSLVNSGLGLVEFERSALEQERRRLWLELNIGAGVSTLLAPPSQSEGRRPGLVSGIFVMLFVEFSDRVRILRLRWFGLGHIPDRQLRRQTARLLAEKIRNESLLRNFDHARRMLTFWRWIHVVLLTVMFVLAFAHIVFGILYKNE